MSIYDSDDYKGFVQDWVRSQKGGGRGVFQQISEHLRIHRSTVSQIFRGEKHLTFEQASDLCDFVGLDSQEALFFIHLVQRERAGSVRLKARVEALLKELRKEMNARSYRAQPQAEISEDEKARFYSSWLNPAVHALCSIDGYQTVSEIAEYFRVEKSKIAEVVSFLKSLSLCVVDDKNRIRPTAHSTYLAPSSNYIDFHRLNWRMKAIDRISRLRSHELAFSAVLSISKSDFAQFKKKLAQLVEELYSVGEKSKAEQLAIFNLDWMEF